MEEERTNLAPRLQQDAYLHGLAAAQPGVSVDFSGYYPNASSQSSAFPYSVDNQSVFNECSNNSPAPFNGSQNFVQGLPAAGISNRYLADPFGYPKTLGVDTDSSLSAQPHVFSTLALNLASPTYAEGGYGGVPAAHQYYSNPSNYPFATDAAFNGTDTFATGPTTYTNGYVTANNPLPMPVSNNPIVPLDIGSMTEGPTPLSPNIYNTGQAIANNSLPVSNNPIVPWDIGFMTEDPFALSPNIYTTGQTSANYPFSMQGTKYPIVPMNTGFTTEPPFGLPPNTYNTGQASANNPFSKPTSNSALIPIDVGPPIPQRALCPECNQTFGRQSDLDRHAKKHQSGPREFKCPVGGCKYESHRKDKLREHVRRRHPGMGVA